MATDPKKHMNVDRQVGEEISPELLQSLIVNGRIQFPFKPTTTSAVSKPGDERDPSSAKVRRENINHYIDEIVTNEELVKMAEDMYDDMTKDMKIPPASDFIAQAAMDLGSPDGTISKEILDRAEAILDSFPYTVGLGNPVLGALTGDPTISGPLLNCNAVTSAIADAWNLGVADDVAEKSLDELVNSPPPNPIQKAEDSFRKKLRAMFAYIIKMLWWEQIYARVVLFVLSAIQGFMARPIDAPFLIFRFKKLNDANFNKYGPIHKQLNRMKKHLLCTVPKNAWSEYRPDPAIMVYDKDIDRRDKFVPLTTWCASNVPNACRGGELLYTPDATAGDAPIPVDNVPNDIKAKIESAFGKNVNCIPKEIMDSLFAETDEGPGVSPRCVEAAKIVNDAVKRDALHFGEYEVSDASFAVASAAAGQVGGLR